MRASLDYDRLFPEMGLLQRLEGKSIIYMNILCARESIICRRWLISVKAESVVV